MENVMLWLQHRETQMFRWVNRRKGNPFLDALLGGVTHLGGAPLTIAVPFLLLLLLPSPWKFAAGESLIALAASHIPVSIIKRCYPRLRPYQVLPDTITGRNPLTDHSFPSGHTTAVFSAVVPFVHALPALGFILLPLAALTGYSRMYLGLHYPSDVAAGALLGTAAALLTAWL